MMKRWIPVVVLLTLALGARTARSQNLSWNSSGVTAATSYYYQSLNTFWPYWYGYYYPSYNNNVTDDGSGGMIVCWVQYSYTWYIYAQRISAQGNVLWTSTTGVTVNNYGNSSNYYCTAVGDGNGGAYIAFDNYNPSTGRYAPFVQYINSAGTVQWGNYGYALGSVSSAEYAYCGYPYLPMMDKDGNGGVVISYYLSTGSYNYGNMYAARLKYTGAGSPSFLWGPTTVFSHSASEQMADASTTNYNYYMNPSICYDGSGGALLAWQTYAAGYKLRVAKISSTGGVTTTNFSVPYVIADYTAYSQGTAYGHRLRVFPDNSGGATVVYPQNTSGYGYTALYASHITWVGGTLAQAWGPTQISRWPAYQQYSQTSPDDAGGVYLTAYDGYSSGQMYLRHISVTGAVLCDVNYMSYPWYPYSSVASDGGGNAIVTWNNQQQIYAQKFNASGTAMWGASGVHVSSSSYSSWMWPEIASDGTGGALIAWNSYNGPSGYYQILTQRVMDTISAAHAQAVGTVINAGNARVGLANGVVVPNACGIKNFAGSQPAAQRAVQVTGATSPDGNVTLSGVTFPVSISPVGTTMMFNVRVTPPRNGPFFDSLYILTNDPIRPRIGFAVTANGIYPHLTASDTCTMPKWRVGTTYTRTFAVTNTGTDVLNISNATISTGDTASFAIVGNPAQAIAPGTQGFITISFTPSTADPKASQLNIVSDDSQYVYFNRPKVVQLSGTGVYPHLTAANSLQFPYTVVNVRTSTASWTVNNTGTDTLHITAANFGGANGAEFQLVTPLPVVVAPGKTVPVSVRWAPMGALGAHAGTMTIIADDSSNVAPNTGYVVTLSGTAVDGAPDFQPSEAMINNGNVHIFRADTISWTMTNTADATKKFIIYSMVVQGDYASQFTFLNPPTLNDTLAIGASQTLRFVFHPNRLGPLPADLHMMTNASPLPIDIAMLGTGVKGQLVASPLDFGRVATDTCAQLPFTVTNYGTDVLTISAFAFLGANSTYYSVAGGTATGSVPMGETKTFTVQFCPTQTGSAAVVARFITSDRDTVFINITGSGAAPSALTMSSTLDFGLVAIDQPLVRTLHVRNAGGVPTQITNLSITGAIPVPFSSTVTLPIALAAGDAVDIPIVFSATTGGPFAATLRLRTPTGGSSPVRLLGYATTDPYAFYPLGLFAGDTLGVGRTVDRSLTIGNFTNAQLQITDIEITGRGADGYRLVDPVSWPVAIAGPNVYDSITVRFAPTRSGYFFAATMDVHLSNGDTLHVPLSGFSTAATGVAGDMLAPGVLALAQNYPNPFGGTTAIGYVLAARGTVTLTLYDVMGRPVRTLVHAAQEAGPHAVNVDAGSLPAGLYTYELRCNGATQSRLLQIVR